MGDPRPLETAEARVLAKRFAMGAEANDEQVPLVVLAQVMKSKGFAAIGIDDPEAIKVAHAAADAGLLIYEGHGDWALTELGAAVLSPVERERLFAWVRARVAEEHARAPHRGHDEYAHTVAFELRIDDEQAWTLIDAAKGWPS